MKSFLTLAAAIVLLAACEPAPQEAGCAECAKMAMEAKAKHDAMTHKEGCKCCAKGEHHAH